MWKFIKLLMVLAVISAAAFYYPQIASKTGTPCEALESKMVAELPDVVTENSPFAIFANVMTNVTQGEIGEAVVADKYPNLPEPLACAIGYYTFDKDDIEL